MDYRVARKEDFPQLAKMRWDFKLEGQPAHEDQERLDLFLKEALSFFLEEDEKGSWTHWVALDKEEIVSHVSVCHIRKVPKPTRFRDEYGYVTNVYTKPAYRGRGIGSALMDEVIQWAKRMDFEILIVWPSSRATPFYERKGFNGQNDVLELTLRPDE